MALYNVLDQAAILESFLIGVIEYEEWNYKELPIPETHLGNFMPAVALVEDWIAKDEEARSKPGALIGYHRQFEGIIKHAMQGLLEPKGKLAEMFGSDQTLRHVYDLCETIHKLLESICKEKQTNPKYFSGKYSKQRREDALQVSKNLIKDKQYKQVYMHTSKGSKNVWHLDYNPKEAFLTRLRIFEEIVNLYTLRSAVNPPKQGRHWVEWAYSDAELHSVIQQYRELE